ncbi:hypothetical protein [Gudongella sp. SC589]|uniref:hypothetical protein n=1 Tax=Gudongella sp. SC589 TaxID=3385990 RepID=UPI0039048F31
MRTYEEIAAEIRNQINIGFDHADGKDKTALVFYDSDAEIIIQALEKQLAKKPERLNAFRSIGKCGGCERVISTRTASAYCQYCGNKVDWRNENETRRSIENNW